MENKKSVTAQEFINTLDYPVIFYNNLFNQSRESAVWHDYEFPFSFDDIEGEVDTEGVWDWNCETDERDNARNSIVRIKIYNEQDFFEKDVINYALFSDCAMTSISEVDEDFIKDQSEYCQVSEKRIAEALKKNLDFEGAKEDAEDDKDALEQIERAEKLIHELINQQ